MTPSDAPTPEPVLIGHERQETHLAKLIAENHLPHALLFTGPKGIGKASLAQKLARFLLAQSSSPKKEEQGGGLFGDILPMTPLAQEGLNLSPDHPIIRRMNAASHPDFLLIRPEFDEKKKEFKSEIPVEEARRVGEFMSLTPSESAWRVALIDSIDALNRNAANALLKVLEEPPAKAVLILISHNPGKLLPTIRSRCQTVVFPPLPESDFLYALAQRQIGNEEGKALAILSGHSPGLALTLHEAGALTTYAALIELAGQKSLTLSHIQPFLDAHVKKDGEQSWQLLGWLFDALLTRLQKDVRDEIVPGEKATLHALATQRPLEAWLDLWEKAIALWSDASRLHLDKRLVLQQLLFEFSQPSSRAA